MSRFWLAGLTLLLLAGACAEDEPDTPAAPVAQTAEVAAFDFYYEPATLLFEPEAQVTIEFVNSGDTTHSLTFDDFEVEVEAASGDSNSVTFVLPDGPGPYEFYCEYHPDEMRGTVSVEADDQDPDDDDDDDDVDVDVDVDDDDDAEPSPTT